MSIDNLDIIKRLIAEKECGRVEFKETTGQLERGMETLCAFLNGEGGTVLSVSPTKGKIIGQDVSDKTKRDIADCDPGVSSRLPQLKFLILKYQTLAKVSSHCLRKNKDICVRSLTKDGLTCGWKARHPSCRRRYITNI